MSESTAKVKRGRRLRGEGSVFKRSSDGRWVGKLTHPRTGKRVVVYGWTAAEARARLDQTKEKIRKRQPVAPERQTVGQFLDQWLASVRPSAPGQTPGYRTYESYAQLVRLHLCPGLGHIKLRQLDAESVQEFINAKLESGLSPRTVQYILAILRMALARAEAWKRVDENVARPLLVKAPSVRRSTQKRRVRSSQPQVGTASKPSSSLPSAPACGKGSSSGSGGKTLISKPDVCMCDTRSRGVTGQASGPGN